MEPNLEQDVLALAVKLMNEAEAETKLNDWGKKESVLNSVEIFFRSMEDIRSHTHPDFIMACILGVKDRLCFRLKVQQELKANPQVQEIKIKDPVFIIGSLRTGSTLFHNLLSVDPATRSPLLYEMRHPTNDPKDVRIETAVKHLRAIGAYDPSMDAKHHMSAVEVEECFQVMDCDVVYDNVYYILHHCRQLHHAVPHSRLVDSYLFHKTMMQLFEFQNSRNPDHWTFKAPWHTRHIQQIREVYPDAKFIWIHRSPKDIASSFMSLLEPMSKMVFGSASEEYNRLRIERQLEFLHENLEKASSIVSEWEKEENPPCVIHCNYKDLKQDPEGLIQKIYAQLGRPFTPEFHENLKKKIVAMETQHKSTPYSHSLADAGLDENHVQKVFATYIDACKGFKFV